MLARTAFSIVSLSWLLRTQEHVSRDGVLIVSKDLSKLVLKLVLLQTEGLLHTHEQVSRDVVLDC